MAGKRLLIIDDEAEITEIIAITLGAMVGWEVLGASTGEEGLALAETHPPDVILLDVILSESEGRTALQQLKSNPATGSIPVLLLTALPLESVALAFADLPIAGIIPKPFEVLTLARLIAFHLNW